MVDFDPGETIGLPTCGVDVRMVCLPQKPIAVRSQLEEWACYLGTYRAQQLQQVSLDSSAVRYGTFPQSIYRVN